MAQPKRRKITTVDNSKQTSLFAYCLPTRTEGQLHEWLAISFVTFVSTSYSVVTVVIKEQ